MAKKYCKNCGVTHTSLMCFYKPRKLPNKRGRVSFSESYNRKVWITENPSDNGYWYCYLRISPLCIYALDEQHLTLDHVKPKGSHIAGRFDRNNLKPACSFCNGLKGSRSLESLAKEYPHLLPLI